MTDLENRIQILQSDLRKQLNVLAYDRRGLAAINKRVGDLVLKALFDEDHPFGARVNSLRTFIADNPPATAKRSACGRAATKQTFALTNKHLFLPQPGTSLRPMREYWPVQLLLRATASSPHRARLTTYLFLSDSEIAKQLAEATPGSISQWSPMQYTQNLLNALVELDYPSSPTPIQLDGRVLRDSDGHTARLSAREARLFKLLLDNIGKSVAYAMMRKAGINYPVQLVHLLRKKLEGGKITLDIQALRMAYMLVEPN